MSLSHPAPLRPLETPPTLNAGPKAPMDAVLAELREIRRVQQQILTLLEGQSVPAFAAFPAVAAAPATAAPRAKHVLVIDDDAASVAEATAALKARRVGVQVASDGNAALAAIAKDRPDAIVMELEIGGSLAGKDMINMVRATMEWVDIPVVLYTRTPIVSLEEARAVHGGDAFVPKAAGSDALVTCVVSVLQR